MADPTFSLPTLTGPSNPGQAAAQTSANMPAPQLPDLNDPVASAKQFLQVTTQAAQGIQQVQQSTSIMVQDTLNSVVEPAYREVLDAQANMTYAAGYPTIVKNLMSLIGDERFNDKFNQAKAASGMTKLQAGQTKMQIGQVAAGLQISNFQQAAQTAQQGFQTSLQISQEKRAQSQDEWTKNTRALNTLSPDALKTGISEGRFTQQQVTEELQRRSTLDLSFKNLQNAVNLNDLQTANAIKGDALSKMGLDGLTTYLEQANANGGVANIKTPYGSFAATAKELAMAQRSYVEMLRTQTEASNEVNARRAETGAVGVEATALMDQATRLYQGAVPADIIAKNKQIMASAFEIDDQGRITAKPLNKDTVERLNKLNEEVKKQMDEYTKAAYTKEQAPAVNQYVQTQQLDVNNAAAFVGGGIVNKTFVVPSGPTPDSAASASAWNTVALTFADRANQLHQSFVALQIPASGSKGKAGDLSIPLRNEDWTNIVQTAIRDTNATTKAQAFFSNIALSESLSALAKAQPQLFGNFVDGQTGNPSVRFRSTNPDGTTYVNWQLVMREMMQKTADLQQSGGGDQNVNLVENFFHTASSTQMAQFMKSKYGPKKVEEAAVARTVGMSDVTSGLPTQIAILRQQLTRIVADIGAQERNQFQQAATQIQAAQTVTDPNTGVAISQPAIPSYEPSERLKRMLGTFAPAATANGQ